MLSNRRIASWREWEWHRAHRVSIGQVAWMVVLFVVLGEMIIAGVIAAVSTPFPALPPLSSPAWRQGPPGALAALIASVALVLAFCAATMYAFVRLGIRIVVASACGVTRANAALHSTLRRGFATARRDPMPASESIQALAPVLAVVGALPFATLAAIWDSIHSVPTVLVPAVLVIGAMAAALVGKALFFNVLPLRAAAQGVASLLPRCRAWEPRRRVMPRCLVCSGDRGVRPRWLRLVNRWKPRVRRSLASIAAAGAKRSAWLALVVKHPLVVLGMAAGCGWLWLIQTGGVSLPATIMITSLGIATGIGILALRGDSKTMFDAMIEGSRNLRSMVFLILAMAAVIANGWGVVALTRLIGPSMLSILGGYDENIAALFLLVAEGTLIYTLLAALVRRGGGTTRWSPREAMRGSILPLFGLATGAADAGWFWLVFATVLGWTAARSKPFRDQWTHSHPSPPAAEPATSGTVAERHVIRSGRGAPRVRSAGVRRS